MSQQTPDSAPESPSSRIRQDVRLLEVDPDLGAELTAEEFELARHQMLLPTVALEVGIWSIEQLHRQPGVGREVHGFLVLSGSVAIDVAIASRVCTSLIGPTELTLLGGPENESVPLELSWSVLEPAMIAVLDERLLVIARRWPGVLIALLKRGAQQTRRVLLQKSISQLPRVEDRLLALMWSIADRRGIVRQDGIWVHLPITHDVLAQMIGARRPTVSLGLKSLSKQGLLRAEADGWLIDRASLAQFGSPDGAKAR